MSRLWERIFKEDLIWYPHEQSQRYIIKRNIIGVNCRRKSMKYANCEKCEEIFENKMDIMQHHIFAHVDVDVDVDYQI